MSARKNKRTLLKLQTHVGAFWREVDRNGYTPQLRRVERNIHAYFRGGGRQRGVRCRAGTKSSVRA